MNALHLHVARKLPAIMRIMRERVWAAANVKLEAVTIDTGTVGGWADAKATSRR